MKTQNYITSREQEVLDLLSSGYSTPEISGILYLSTETIKTHRKRLIEKLNAKNVANLIRIAFETKLITTNHSIDTIKHHFNNKLEMVA